MQTVALWLKNTDYKEQNPAYCMGAVKFAALLDKVKLFQRKKVHEILWGYTDPFLKSLSMKIPGCQSRQGLSAFVQLQVGRTLLVELWLFRVRVVLPTGRLITWFNDIRHK